LNGALAAKAEAIFSNLTREDGTMKATNRGGFAPCSPNGELVSGFKFAGWMEGGKAKVIVWALLNNKDAEFATTDEEKLQGQLIDAYLIDPGEKLKLKDMERYGVKPVDLVISRTRSR
jgi:hypothetical protein